jgi:hypothetical protein
MATTVYRGLNLNWGTIPSGSVSAFGSCKVQTANMTKTGDELEIRDEVGDQVSWVGYGVKRTFTFTYYATSAQSGSATGTQAVSSPLYGDICSITDPSGKFPYSTGSYVAKDTTINTSNTDATKVDVALTAYPEITT